MAAAVGTGLRPGVAWLPRCLCPVLLITVLMLSCVPIELGPGGSDLPFDLSVVLPDSSVIVGSPAVEALVQWVDTGTLPGSVVRVEVERPNPNGGGVLVARVLVGRDAVADGDGDKFVWDGTDVDGTRLPGASYVVRVIMDGPNGEVANRTASGRLVIPFTFRGVGLFDDDASFTNNGGAGPFRLIDTDADFIRAGVTPGRTVSILGGSGVALGDFTVTGVTIGTLTVDRDAGDSAGDANVQYFVSVASAALNAADDSTIIAWTDEVSATTIQLSADPDDDHANGNEAVILQERNIADEGEDDRFEWTGVDVDGARLAAGTYRLFATLDPDAANPIVVDLTDGLVTIGNAPPSMEITSPSEDVTVASGGTLLVVYTAGDPDNEATITFAVDPDTTEDDPNHDSGNETTVESDIKESDGSETFIWDTVGTAGGTYTLFGRIDDGHHDPVTASAAGRVTLGNSPPRVTFRRPEGKTANVTNSGGLGPFLLTDASADFVAEGVTIGNIVLIDQGTDAITGSYVVREVAATALTLDKNAGDSGSAGDVSYRVAGHVSVVVGGTFSIKFETKDPDNSFRFDLVIDYDDDDANNNSRVILNNRLAAAGGPTLGSFTWDTTGVPVGTYRLFARSRDGINAEAKDFLPARLLLRSAADSPYIELLGPATEISPARGNTVAIAWADEETDEDTIIDLVFDDDAVPNQAAETGEPEQTVLGSVAMNLDADADDAADGFAWEWHPSEITRPAVAEGDYFVFAYLSNDVLSNGDGADVENAGGAGPFKLIDSDADFVADGVTTTHEIRVGAGTGVNPGAYGITAVSRTELTLASDAGDSAGAGDVAYNVRGPRDQADSIAVADGTVKIPNSPPELQFRRPFGRRASLANRGGAGPFELTDSAAGFLERGVAVGHVVHVDAAEGVTAGDYEIVAVGATRLTLGRSAGDSGGRTNVSYQVMGPLEALPGSAPIIAWFDRDPDETVINIDLFLDPDGDRENGNEIQFANNRNKSARQDVLNTFAWTGTRDLSGTPVEAGQFNLFASLDDGRNEEVTVASSEQLNLRPDDEISSGTTANVSNGGGPGPFILTQGGATFLADGVEAGHVVRILAGTGTTPGLYRVSEPIGDTSLTLQGDAGRSSGAGNVRFVVFKPNPVIVLVSQQTPTTAVQGETVVLSWTDLTFSGQETVQLYYDLDSDPTSGGANGGLGTLIKDNLPAGPDGGLDSFNWNLPLSGPNFVPEGRYFIHARLMQNGVQKDISTSRSTVEVVGPNITPTLRFLAPLTIVDTNLATGTPVNVEWEYRSGRAGTIRLDLDQDEVADNGEQTNILDDRPQAGAPAPAGTTDSLSFALIDSAGAPVPTGEYFLRGTLSVLGQSPVTAVAAGKLLIRKAAGDPLITLTQPSADTQLTLGDTTTITIEWSVDDPTGAAVVDLWFDTVPGSDGGAAPPRDGGFIGSQNRLASNRSATWSVPATLAEGVYYIHARIEKSDGDDDDRSTAIGRLRIVRPQ